MPRLGLAMGLSRRKPSFAGLLDQYGSAEVAYSPLALSSDYVNINNTILAQRDGDDATQGFTQQEILNGDLVTFANAGGGNAYVYTYYDQSGNGNNLTQATRSAQHQIVASGELIKQQDAVACVSTGTSYYDFDSPVVLSGAFTISSIVEYGIGGNGVLLGATGSIAPRLRAIPVATDWEIVNDAGAEANISKGWSKDRTRVHHIRTSGNSNSLYLRNGQAGLSASLSGTFTFSRAFARNNGLGSIDGKIQALVIWSSDQTSNLGGIDFALNRLLLKPKEIFIMLGQSNMVGRDVDGTNLTDRDNDENLLERRYIGTTDEIYGRFLDYYPSGSVTSFGPNVGMARTLYDNGRRNINILRYAVGGTSVASFLQESRRLLDPQDDLPPGDTDQWDTMVAYLNNSIDKIMVDSGTACTFTFIWYQGAEDANYTGTEGGYTQDLAGMYETHLTRLIEDLRANITGATAATPWVIIRSPDWGAGPGSAKPGQTEVRAAQVAVANADDNAQWLTSDINQGVTTTWEDASHIDAASQERLGIDLAALV